jgi:SAM-dependent methyltransferase
MRGGDARRDDPATVPARMRPLDRLTDPAQFDLRPAQRGRILDVGCGSKKPPGAVGIDLSPQTDADVVHDLNTRPWPLESDSFDEILLQDVLEHLREPYEVFAEVHRVARPGARVQLRTPHFSSSLAYSDPTHLHFFSAAAIRALAEPGFSHYSDVRFRIVEVVLDLWLPFRLLGVAKLANRWPDTYEKYLAFRFPAMNVRAEFEVIK